jgi:hypothetical protein
MFQSTPPKCRYQFFCFVWVRSLNTRALNYVPKCRPMQHTVSWSTGISTRRPFYSGIKQGQQRIDHPTSHTAAYLGPRFSRCHMHQHNSSGPSLGQCWGNYSCPCGIAERQLIICTIKLSLWLNIQTAWWYQTPSFSTGGSAVITSRSINGTCWQIACEHHAGILTLELSPPIAD